MPPVWAEVETLSVGNRAWTCSWEISAPFRFVRPATNSECDLDKALISLRAQDLVVLIWVCDFQE